MQRTRDKIGPDGKSKVAGRGSRAFGNRSPVPKRTSPGRASYLTPQAVSTRSAVRFN
jgi:hypothetical protein